jgi:hypothetical protein
LASWRFEILLSSGGFGPFVAQGLFARLGLPLEFSGMPSARSNFVDINQYVQRGCTADSRYEELDFRIAFGLDLPLSEQV